MGRATVSVIAAALVASSALLAQTPTSAVAPVGQTMEKAAKPDDRKEFKKKEVSGQKVATKQVVVEKVAKQAVAVAKVAQNLAPLVDQFSRQGRPYVRAELLFVRKTCQTTTAQLRTISHEADDALKTVVTEMAEAQQRPRRAVVNGRVQTPQQLDGGKLLQDALGAVMKKNLSADQWSRYQTELEKRDRSRKESGLKYMVDAVDRELYLSQHQRDKLAESLSAHWDAGWGLYLEYVLYGNQFYPMTIDQYVSPLLNEHQVKVWQSAQRVGGFWGFGAVWGGFMNDDDALEEELGEAKKKPAGVDFAPQLQIFAAPVAGPAPKTIIRRIDVKKAGTKGAGENH
jgi:hypothetical protein